MIVTNYAVEYLVAGAEMANMDINAVDSTGVEYDAGQVCTEDDHVMRKQLSLNEYQPTLEVSELTWHGTFFRYPNLTIMVTDGKLQMMLRPSFRKKEFAKVFYAKQGHIYTGRMNVGMRIRLLDYTTSIWMSKDGVTHPCIFVEKIRPEPKRVSSKKK